MKMFEKSAEMREKSPKVNLEMEITNKVKKWPVGKKVTLLKVMHQNRSIDPTKIPKNRHLCGCN